MNVNFNDVKRKEVMMTEVTFNRKMIYIVHPREAGDCWAVVEPFMTLPSRTFNTFDEASAYAAAFVTGSNYD